MNALSTWQPVQAAVPIGTAEEKKANISDGYSFSGPQPQLKAQLVPMYRSLPNAPTPHQVHTHTPYAGTQGAQHQPPKAARSEKKVQAF